VGIANILASGVVHQLFARAGATVVSCDRKSDGLEETRESAEREGLTFQQSIVEDLAQSEAAKEWIDEAVGQSGHLSVLHNNAALGRLRTHRVNDAEAVDGNVQRRARHYNPLSL
jgi:NAD(P)-dependent dehydrogenase (short-subunit alcohol dehydrogenase family)